jgi:hypothetical protein
MCDQVCLINATAPMVPLFEKAVDHLGQLFFRFFFNSLFTHEQRHRWWNVICFLYHAYIVLSESYLFGSDLREVGEQLLGVGGEGDV